MVEWWRRSERLFPVRDLIAITAPHRAARMMLDFLRSPRKGLEHTEEADARDPELLRLVVDFWRAAGRYYFRSELVGVDNVPPSGPALLVGNHNGGMLTTEAYLTLVAIWDRYGPGRAVRPLAHDFVFHDPLLRRYALRFGAIRAGHLGAHNAFRRGELVLVYPGSDIDSFRPFRDRHRVLLGGRHGFVKLALREQVPIVPVATVGAHEQFIVLTEGQTMARITGLKRWARVDVMPFALSIPWGIAPAFLPYIPLPAKITLSFGEPLCFPHYGPEAADNPEIVEWVYARVQAALQEQMDRLSAGRRPWIG